MGASKDQYFSKVISKVKVGAILIEFYTFSFIQTTLCCLFCGYTCSAFISSGCSWSTWQRYVVAVVVNGILFFVNATK